MLACAGREWVYVCVQAWVCSTVGDGLRRIACPDGRAHACADVAAHAHADHVTDNRSHRCAHGDTYTCALGCTHWSPNCIAVTRTNGVTDGSTDGRTKQRADRYTHGRADSAANGITNGQPNVTTNTRTHAHANKRSKRRTITGTDQPPLHLRHTRVRHSHHRVHPRARHQRLHMRVPRWPHSCDSHHVRGDNSSDCHTHTHTLCITHGGTDDTPHTHAHHGANDCAHIDAIACPNAAPLQRWHPRVRHGQHLLCTRDQRCRPQRVRLSLPERFRADPGQLNGVPSDNSSADCHAIGCAEWCPLGHANHCANGCTHTFTNAGANARPNHVPHMGTDAAPLRRRHAPVRRRVDRVHPGAPTDGQRLRVRLPRRVYPHHGQCHLVPPCADIDVDRDVHNHDYSGPNRDPDTTPNSGANNRADPSADSSAHARTHTLTNDITDTSANGRADAAPHVGANTISDDGTIGSAHRFADLGSLGIGVGRCGRQRRRGRQHEGTQR